MVELFKKKFDLLIIANLAVYGLLAIKGVSLTEPTSFDLIFWGGNLAPLTLAQDPWRLLTSMFLHAGPIHLIFNMVVLFQLGRIAQMTWGRFQFLILYFLTGVFGSLTTAWWFSQNPQPIVSVGASGAIMGLAAACLVRSLWPGQSDLKADWKNFAQLVGLNIGLGFFIPGIDNAAHIGGAVSGVIIATLLLTPWFSKNLTSLKLISLLTMGSGIAYGLTRQITTPEINAFALEIKKEIAQQIEKKEASEIALEEQKARPLPVDFKSASGTSLAIEGGAVDFIQNQAGTRAYISHASDNSITLIDLTQFKISKKIMGPELPSLDESGCNDNVCRGIGASGIALSKDGELALVSSIKKDSVAFLNLKTETFDNFIPVGRFPRKIALGPSEKWAIAFNAVDNSVSIIDVQNKELKETKKLSVKNASDLPFGRFLNWHAALKSGQLFIFDAIENKILTLNMDSPSDFKKGISLLDFWPSKSVLSTDEKTLWISGYQDSNFILRSYKTDSFEKSKEIIICSADNVGNFAISADNNSIAIEDLGSKSIRLISLKSYTTLRVFPYNSVSSSLHFSQDSKKIYLLSQPAWDSTLTVLDVDKTLDVAKHVSEYSELFCSL